MTVVLVLSNLCWLHRAYYNIVVIVVPRMVVVVYCRKVIVVVAITVKVGEIMCKFWFVCDGVCSGFSNTVVIIVPRNVP